MAELSPMMRQYFSVKDKHKDAIVFFRLGDFYEMFYEDAELVSRELNLTLTGRDCGQDDKAPMCGIPFHSCDSYIRRLVSKGYKIAMCDQVEDPSKAKGIVKREVVRVITPGTLVEESMLDEAKNNFICCIYMEDKAVGICFCDVSTGKLMATELHGDDILCQLRNELGRMCPSEVLIGGKISLLEPLKEFMKDVISCRIEIPDELSFNVEICKKVVLKNLKCKSIDDTNLQNRIYALICIGALFSYLRETQKNGIDRIEGIELYTESQYIGLDLNTIRNLELLETAREKDKKGSLLWVLDKTKTAMGKRLIRSWIEHPLMDCSEIIKRQDAIEELFKDVMMRDSLFEALSGIRDIERLITRVNYGSANCRDFKLLSYAISKIPDIKESIKSGYSDMLKDIYQNMDDMSDLYNIIEGAIVENPPFSVREGGMIKDGYNSLIDELRVNMTGGAGVIASIEQRERKKTGINKLKVGYNRVYGYYIEVTNSFKSMVPDSYIRKQTLTNCERYITQELKELEEKILGAKEKAVQLEYEIFEEIREKISSQLGRIGTVAGFIGLLDVLRSLAEVAVRNDYIRPRLSQGNSIILKESRHPVVELILGSSPFVPNNAILDNDENMIAIITGPNMAGKSTYMRQIALIVLMSQIGSFVPAIYAEIGIVDSIFTRIGASDDLASGKSTFMVEMSEVAQIMRDSTSKSLLILDEIGRGTSTFDGMSIARAVIEYISDKKKLGAKTLFSTHYHELTVMGEKYSGIKNYNIAVKKRGDEITFLRRIVPGGADDSYGIEVAKLAGLPEWIILRARDVLQEIERENKAPVTINESYMLKLADKGLPKEETLDKSKEILEKLRGMDANVLTPIESMNVLFELISLASL